MELSDKSKYKVITVVNQKDKVRFTETWHSIWLEEEYATASENIVEKYKKYESNSIDHLLVDQFNNALGTMRIVYGDSKVGLPVLNDFSIQHPLSNKSNLCEATLLTIKSNARAKDHYCTFLLLIELWRYARTNNIDGILIAADIRLWYLLTRKLNLCFTEIGERQLYEGSVTVPGYLSVKEQKEKSLSIIPKNIFEVALNSI